jgi:hypothetical protein
MVESCVGGMITNDARCKCEIKSRIATANQHPTRRNLFSPSKLDLKVR